MNTRNATRSADIYAALNLNLNLYLYRIDDC
jgi:hypothetical protein